MIPPKPGEVRLRGRPLGPPPEKKNFVRSPRCPNCFLPIVYSEEIHFDNHPECKPAGWTAPPKDPNVKLVSGVIGEE